jgi:hypothetical protein
MLAHIGVSASDFWVVFANAWKGPAPIAHLDVCTLALPGTQSDALDRCRLQAPGAALTLRRLYASTERRRGLFGREVETCSAGYLARELSCYLNSGYRRSTLFSIGKWRDCKDFHDRTKVKRFCFDRARFLSYLLVSDKSFGPSENPLPRRWGRVSTCKLNYSRRRRNQHPGSSQRVPVIGIAPEIRPSSGTGSLL